MKYSDHPNYLLYDNDYYFDTVDDDKYTLAFFSRECDEEKGGNEKAIVTYHGDIRRVFCEMVNYISAMCHEKQDCLVVMFSSNKNAVINFCGQVASQLPDGVYTDGEIGFPYDDRTLLGGTSFDEDPHNDPCRACTAALSQNLTRDAALVMFQYWRYMSPGTADNLIERILRDNRVKIIMVHLKDEPDYQSLIPAVQEAMASNVHSEITLEGIFNTIGSALMYDRNTGPVDDAVFHAFFSAHISAVNGLLAEKRSS